MYFKNCNTIIELNEVREQLINSIQQEYSEKLKEIKSKAGKASAKIYKARSIEVLPDIAMPYIISDIKGDSNRIIFKNDGTVII